MEASLDFQTRYKKVLLRTFKYVIEFLNAHNLQWFCCYGTLIGAVRHNGLIPWDDDVDICMPKDDFDKLVSFSNELEENHYRLLSFSNVGYNCPHSKIIDTNTTIWEREHYPFITGVFVDIFPLYKVDNKDLKLKEELRKYKELSKSVIRTTKKIPFRFFLRSILNDHDRVWREYLINMIIYPKCRNKYYFNKLKVFEETIYNKNGEYAICLAILEYGDKEIMKASYFSDFLEVPFEDFKVRIPIGYHQYLSQLYGDYLTPPPEDERVPKHDSTRYYTNLNEGLTIKEVRRRMKSKGKKGF